MIRREKGKVSGWEREKMIKSRREGERRKEREKVREKGNEKENENVQRE
jgi:hypothetical protein